jgi:hypothetical protein
LLVLGDLSMGSDTIIVAFKKINIALPNFGGEDCLLGYHTYKKGL